MPNSWFYTSWLQKRRKYAPSLVERLTHLANRANITAQSRQTPNVYILHFLKHEHPVHDYVRAYFCVMVRLKGVVCLKENSSYMWALAKGPVDHLVEAGHDFWKATFMSFMAEFWAPWFDCYIVPWHSRGQTSLRPISPKPKKSYVDEHHYRWRKVMYTCLWFGVELSL